ncbi:hypothetical protein ALNOE001_08990 [Candidatus Methanobinarius endosymbioticus]|uniref:Thiamine biosynthesis protein ThiS n=1 Tax=Candidatus Methanobinarius endosymbioticus TaxID=2006182 RepID=A0A366MCC4_9EURY|nr:hypothetical protein ALNOE001_08990 [Candidatus Methanobinarius endosymbioticus]
MNFTLIFNDKKEIKSLNKDTSIKNVLDEMELSSEIIIAKKNGDIVIEDEKIENGDEIHLIQIIYGG